MCIRDRCAEILHGLGGGEVLELGAGSGVMAAAMLAELDRREALPARYRILDVSADYYAKMIEKAIGEGLELIRRGKTDIVLAGGTVTDAVAA